MKDFISDVYGVFLTLLGLAVFLSLMWLVARSHSHMWRRLAAHYRGQAGGARLARKLPETIIVADRGAIPPGLRHRLYAGAVIAIHEEGLAISLVPIPPLNIMTPPLFLPFDDMRVEQTEWALWPEPFALRMASAPDLDVIVDRGVVRWIREHIARPPFGPDS